MAVDHSAAAENAQLRANEGVGSATHNNITRHPYSSGLVQPASSLERVAMDITSAEYDMEPFELDRRITYYIEALIPIS